MAIKEIKNLEGEPILSYDEDDERWISGNYDLADSNLENADLEFVIWQDINLKNAKLKKAEFYDGILFGSDLSESDCEETKFLGTDLKEVNFTKANLRNAIFGRNNLGGIVNISSANFTEANLEGVKFEGTRYNYKTIFPKSFNPEKHGLIRIENE